VEDQIVHRYKTTWYISLFSCHPSFKVYFFQVVVYSGVPGHSSLYDCCLFVQLPSLCTTAVSLYDCRLFVSLPSLCTTAVSLYDCRLFVRLLSLCTTAVSLYVCRLFVGLPSLCTTAVSLYDGRIFVRVLSLVRLPSLCNYSKSWIIRHKRSNKSIIRTMVVKQTDRLG
jgi:hypothetical protein